ncbi:MAG: flagellar basal body rod protein FlgB [Planctomycetes bacterium]|nr:flagellar basal body rod protein FlgB [Planctomycetota bacterium]
MNADLFARELRPLEGLLNGAAERHRVITGNLANLETPGYTRRDVTFETELGERIREGMSLRDALSQVEPRVVIDRDSPARADGNNVDLERETSELQKNELLYDLYARVLSMRIQQFQTAIHGR